jgi:hypothetical protein
MVSSQKEISMSSVAQALTEDPRLLQDPDLAKQAQLEAFEFCSSNTLFFLEDADPRAVAANPEQYQADLINTLF